MTYAGLWLEKPCSPFCFPLNKLGQCRFVAVKLTCHSKITSQGQLQTTTQCIAINCCNSGHWEDSCKRIRSESHTKRSEYSVNHITAGRESIQGGTERRGRDQSCTPPLFLIIIIFNNNDCIQSSWAPTRRKPCRWGKAWSRGATFIHSVKIFVSCLSFPGVNAQGGSQCKIKNIQYVKTKR